MDEEAIQELIEESLLETLTDMDNTSDLSWFGGEDEETEEE